MSKSRPPSKKRSKSPSIGFPPNPDDDRGLKIKSGEPSTSRAGAAPSPSPTLTPASDSKPRFETPSSAEPEPDMPPTPVLNANKAPPAGPQLIGHLPLAEKEALSTFTEIAGNQYQYGTLGRSREALESMTCDCQYDHGRDSPWVACGHDSDCINRLTQVECQPEDCRCQSYCQNQRFQRREYANINIVQTEKKGFGLRAATNLPKDTFIHEYVGDVVNRPSLKKRMRDYATEGIRHFYFMMLQKDEFIDATKRGGIGRFANHSCSPNCYVAKWTVGHYIRMGIFANRNIKADEELTFNYNVDRYGHDAQPCYCGEAKCVGFIGGKTQTDIAAMDDLYLDALGISDEVDRLGMKGSKKKKSKKFDDVDFAPILKPLVEKDVPKVVQAVRQTQSRKVLLKLLTRIKITEDQPALRQIMRLRGFSLMNNILEDYANDLDILALVLGCMTTWPLEKRNKVDDSKVTVPVTLCAESENENIRMLAQKLLDHWDTLEAAYRIPKRLMDGDDDRAQLAVVTLYQDDEEESRHQKRSKYVLDESDFKIKPLGFTAPELAPRARKVSTVVEPVSQQNPRQSVAAIIAAAAAAAAAATSAATVNVKPASVPEENGAKKARPPKKHQSREEKEANKEKRLLKLVGAVVVKCMSKHRHEMDHDMFKKHAKQLTQVITDKEKKSASYSEGRLESLSDEKVTKIKKFAKDYIAKVLRKLEKAGQRRRPLSTAMTQATASSSLDTPNSHDGASADAIPGGEGEVEEEEEEEAMDIDSGSDSEADGERGNEVEDDQGDGESRSLPPDAVSASPSDRPESLAVSEPLKALSVSPFIIRPTDPRRRPPSDDQESRWDPDEDNGRGDLRELNGLPAGL